MKTRQSLIDYIKESEQEFQDNYSGKEFDEITLGLNIILDATNELAINTLEAIDKLSNNPEFNQLVEASIKMNEVKE